MIVYNLSEKPILVHSAIQKHNEINYPNITSTEIKIKFIVLYYLLEVRKWIGIDNTVRGQHCYDYISPR